MAAPRLAFVGLGWIGRHRLAALAAAGGAQIVALVDPDPVARRHAAALVPEARVLERFEDLDGLALDGVVLATPNALHAPHACAALRAGWAVFCQKPLGRTAAETRAVLDAARAADRLVGVDLSYRFSASAHALRRALREGAIGRPFAVDLVFHNAYGPSHPWAWQRREAGGGCLLDLGVHLLDLALWALDFPPAAPVAARLYAGGAPLPPDGEAVEDYAVAFLTLGSAAVRVACSWRAHPGAEATIEALFHGPDGALRLANRHGSFYDLDAELRRGAAVQPLGTAEEDARWRWGPRALVAWAERLARDPSFDPEAERLVDVAALLDALYAAAGRRS